MRRQPSVEDVEDEEATQPRRAVPKKASRILELADSSDDDDDDAPLAGSKPDDEAARSDEEAPAESEEAELSMCPLPVKDF
jgi:hypothetical protein